MGSIVRTANGFGVRRVHIIGRKQWNKRGAMATDKYLHVEYHDSVESFGHAMNEKGRILIVVDNVSGASDITHKKLPPTSVLVFGSEGSGVSEKLLAIADTIVAIHQTGSTRSLNVAAAAAIAMYEWVRQRQV
jgi:tRNA G18 (ribose-2'-O)-methylase SpoU